MKMDNKEQNKITRKFPDHPKQAIEQQRASALMVLAFRDILNVWMREEPSVIHREIWRPKDGGMASTRIPFPNYFASVHDRHEELLSLPSVFSFLDYFWTCGQCQITLEGPDPKRRSWEIWVLVDEILTPLASALTHQAMIDASCSLGITPFFLADIRLTQLAETLIDLHCREVIQYSVKCPLFWLEDSIWDLGSGMRITPLSPADEALYLTELELQVSTLGLGGELMSGVGLLEFNIEIGRDAIFQGAIDAHSDGILNLQEVLKKRIGDTIDMVKWALSIGCSHAVPLLEGTSSYRNVKSMGLLGPDAFRRLQTRTARSGTVYQQSPEALHEAQAALQRASRFATLVPDVYDALWYWGRACLAELDRDRLLESVIGIERLLVPGGGESRYRIGLHGAAMLAKDQTEAREKAKQLRDMFQARSSVAHGAVATKGKNLTYLALQTLGELVAVVTAELNAGRLMPTPTISEQVQDQILMRVVKRH